MTSTTRQFSRLLFFIVAVILMAGCATPSGQWQQRDQAQQVEYYERKRDHSPIPEFLAVVPIRASVPDIMQVLTDFRSYPEWMHRCESVRILDTQGFQLAHLYQVTNLPFVSDRDIILRGEIDRDPGSADEVVIRLEATPDYCSERTGSRCDATRDTGRVRMERSDGTFRLRQREDGLVEVRWQQHLEPGGAVPAWLTRLFMKQVPIQSLRNLKERVESTEP